MTEPEHQHVFVLEHVQMQCWDEGCEVKQVHTAGGELFLRKPGDDERASRQYIDWLEESRLRALQERDQARAELARLRGEQA